MVLFFLSYQLPVKFFTYGILLYFKLSHHKTYNDLFYFFCVFLYPHTIPFQQLLKLERAEIISTQFTLLTPST